MRRLLRSSGIVIYFAGLFRLVVQSFRLLRRDRFDYRNDTYTYTCNAASWRFRTSLRPAAQGIQSNKVSQSTDQSNLFVDVIYIKLYKVTSTIFIFYDKYF